MAWLYNPTGWTSAYGPVVEDFVNIWYDLHYPGGDVSYSGNYVRTVGAVQFQAAAKPGSGFSVTGGSWSGGHATITVGSHTMIAGQLVTVAGVTPSGYNVSLAPITSVGSTTITYAVASNPGSWSSGGTVIVGGTLTNGMMAVDASGLVWVYNTGAWSQVAAAAQTPWIADVNAAGHNLLACPSITLTPGSLPAAFAGKMAVDATYNLRVNNGSSWLYAGLQDPGSSGILKRSALNVTAVAGAGTDYYAPGGTIAAADLPVFVASGAGHAKGAVPDPGASSGITHFLREDGTWAIPAGSGGGGLADPGSNGLIYRSALNVTRPGVAGSEYYAPGSAIAVSDLPFMVASGPGHSPGMVPDPGGASGSAKYLCENGAWSVPPVTVLQGRAVASTPPSDTQVLAWNDAAHQWQPTAAGGASSNASQLQGYNISSAAPLTNQALVWSGSAWTPAVLSQSQSVLSTDYTFNIAAIGNLSIGSNTITLPGTCPLGLNGNDVGHSVYLSAGAGAAEAVVITGGTARSGVAGGTLTFSCANTHTGAWTMTSATGGIQEASVAFGGYCTVELPIGTTTLYGTLVLPVTANLLGQGPLSCILSAAAGVSPAVVVGSPPILSSAVGMAYHHGYKILGTQAGYGLWLGGDPAGGFAPSNYCADYCRFDSVDVNSFAYNITIQAGSFIGFMSCHSATVSGPALYIPNGGGGQPIEFFGCVMSADTGNAVLINDPYSDVHYFGGQISGTISSVDGINFTAVNTHYEPNEHNVPVVNIASNASFCMVSLMGGEISFHGTSLANGISMSGTSHINLFVKDVILQCDVGMTVTNFAYFDPTYISYSRLELENVLVIPAGTFTNLYSLAGVAALVRVNQPAGMRFLAGAATIAFPAMNYPVAEIVGINSWSGTTTAVTGLTAGQSGILFTYYGFTFQAGGSIGNTKTLSPSVPYTWYYDGTKLWFS